MSLFTKVTLQNFRSFDNIEFNLTNKGNSPKHLAMIYGENGAGKSNLMSAFVLLNELLDTLNVRDLYETLLTKEAFVKNEDLKKRLMDSFRDIKAIIDDCRMINNDNNIVVEYEFTIDSNTGKYYIEFDEEEIVHERLEYLLNKRRGVFFDCTPKNISINSGIFNDSDLFFDIKSYAKRFWGKHSLLAIVLHEMTDKSKTFGWDNLGKNFYDVIIEFTLLSSHLDIGTRSWNELNAPNEIFENAIENRISKSNEEQLDIAEKIFTNFFTSINSNIIRAYYKRTYDEKNVNYELYLEKNISNSIRNIPFSKESTGNHQLIKFLCYILCACLGKTVVFDEADTGIHDILFKKILVEVEPLITGQLIITTHNTMLMEEDFSKDSVYIIYEDSGRNVIKTINDYEKRTYANNNIRNKYLNNDYKGIPTIERIDFTSIIELLKKNL